MFYRKKTLALLEISKLRNHQPRQLSRKGLSLSMNFKYSVGWKKPSALERRWKRLWLEKDNLSGSPWVVWGSQLSFQRLTSEVTANTPSHMFVKCADLQGRLRKRPPQQRLKSPFYSLNQCFSWFQRTTIQLFFFPLPSFNSRAFLSVDFHEPLPNTRCKLEKIPLANFSIGRPTVLSTEPLFSKARSSDLCPWAHTSPGVSLSSTSVTHEKTPLWWLPLQTPQPRGSDTSACEPGHLSGGKPEGFLADPTFKCSTVPISDM